MKKIGVRKILAGLGGLGTAAVLAACSSGAPNTVAVQPAAAASTSVPGGSTAPVTTAPAPATTSAPLTTSSPASSRSTPPAPKTTTSKPKPATTPAANPGVPCSITNGACVDLSAKRAWLLQDGKVIYGPVPIEPGPKSYPTPTGMFHVLSREKMHYSREFNNAPMPNSVFFYPGDAFHTGSLSTPSHGCIHLSSTASLKFFNTLHVGDPVQIRG